MFHRSNRPAFHSQISAHKWVRVNKTVIYSQIKRPMALCTLVLTPNILNLVQWQSLKDVFSCLKCRISCQTILGQKSAFFVYRLYILYILVKKDKRTLTTSFPEPLCIFDGEIAQRKSLETMLVCRHWKTH